MISKLRDSFRRDFARLPRKIQERAREAYRRFLRDPFHASLAFKRLNTDLPLWSVRITESYRAIGGPRRRDDQLVFYRNPCGVRPAAITQFRRRDDDCDWELASFLQLDTLPLLTAALCPLQARHSSPSPRWHLWEATSPCKKQPPEASTIFIRCSMMPRSAAW